MYVCEVSQTTNTGADTGADARADAGVGADANANWLAGGADSTSLKPCGTMACLAAVE